MHHIFVALRIFPFWALPLAFVLAELGWYFRRKGSKKQFYCWIIVATLIGLSIAWFVFRGDLYSDSWLKAWFA